jgi:hypothetical protein
MDSPHLLPHLELIEGRRQRFAERCMKQGIPPKIRNEKQSVFSFLVFLTIHFIQHSIAFLALHQHLLTVQTYKSDVHTGSQVVMSLLE